MITVNNLDSFEFALHHFAAVTLPVDFLEEVKNNAAELFESFVEKSPFEIRDYWKMSVGKKPENGSSDIKRVLSAAKLKDIIWIYNDAPFKSEYDDGDSTSAPRGFILGSLQELDLL